MKNTFDTYRPEGFSTINPYLFSENAQELGCAMREGTEEIANIILKIGESCIMISQASGNY